MPDAQLLPTPGGRDGTVLLVSADRTWLASTTAFLVASTRALATAETATEAVAVAMSGPPDVAVIAPPLGDGSPLALINQLTTLRDHVAIGIIYVSDREREFAEHSRLMRAGVNDWFPRGLSAPDAARRISALLSEISSSDPSRPVERGPLTLHPVERQATVSGSTVNLTDREFLILSALAGAAGRLMGGDEVARAIGMRRGPNVPRAVSESIDSLHEKLGAARGLLESSRRNGYRLRFVAPL